MVERSWSERRIITSKRRLPSTICDTLRPFDRASNACVTAAGRQPVERRALVVDLDAQLRDEHLLLDLKIDQARHRRELLARRLGETAQRLEVVAENLQDDLRAHARLQVVEPVADRLADGDRNRQRGEAARGYRRRFPPSSAPSARGPRRPR